MINLEITMAAPAAFPGVPDVWHIATDRTCGCSFSMRRCPPGTGPTLPCVRMKGRDPKVADSVMAQPPQSHLGSRPGDSSLRGVFFMSRSIAYFIKI